MSYQKIYKLIKNIDTKSTKKELLQQVEYLKALADKETKKISNANKKQYLNNLDISRKKRKINNSKQAIKKAWNNRNNKKELIKKHINLLRGYYEN